MAATGARSSCVISSVNWARTSSSSRSLRLASANSAFSRSSSSRRALHSALAARRQLVQLAHVLGAGFQPDERLAQLALTCRQLLAARLALGIREPQLFVQLAHVARAHLQPIVARSAVQRTPRPDARAGGCSSSLAACSCSFSCAHFGCAFFGCAPGSPPGRAPACVQRADQHCSCPRPQKTGDRQRDALCDHMMPRVSAAERPRGRASGAAAILQPFGDHHAGVEQGRQRPQHPSAATGRAAPPP